MTAALILASSQGVVVRTTGTPRERRYRKKQRCAGWCTWSLPRSPRCLRDQTTCSQPSSDNKLESRLTYLLSLLVTSTDSCTWLGAFRVLERRSFLYGGAVELNSDMTAVACTSIA
jgi:hypothetical protein